MLNEQRIEHLRLQIQASRLLDDHEKADWLNLLELMNDKQLGELEEILAAPAQSPIPAAAPKPMPPAMPAAAAPPLSHITNLPTGLNQPVPNEPVIKDSPSLIKAKPLPPPTRPIIPKVINPKPQPRPAQVDAPPPTRSNLPPMNPLVLKDLSGVQALSPNTLRQHEHNSVITAIQMIAQSYGYFAALQNLEASPLYAAYLQAGKNRLAGKPDSTLSQAEFETVTDILLGMRLNRG